MKTLILYKTKNGTTRQYAKWIQEDISDSTLKDINEVTKEESFDEFDVIIIGSRTYMGKVAIKDQLVGIWPKIKDKKVVFYTVGMVPWEAKESQSAYSMIPVEIREGIVGHVKLQGRIKLSQLNVVERLMIKAMKVTEEDRVVKENIIPVMELYKKAIK